MEAASLLTGKGSLMEKDIFSLANWSHTLIISQQHLTSLFQDIKKT